MSDSQINRTVRKLSSVSGVIILIISSAEREYKDLVTFFDDRSTLDSSNTDRLNPSALSRMDRRYCFVIAESVGCSMLVLSDMQILKRVRLFFYDYNFANLEKKIQY